jgi:hypothetical protein
MLQKLFFTLTIVCLINCSHKKEERIVNKTSTTPAAKPNAELQRLQTHAAQLLNYAKRNNCNTTTAFLFDMNKASGSKRFYVYDFSKNKILHKGLVTHGNCGEAFLMENRYGNTVGCNCTSLGKYKIGNKYYGRFGLAYKLHGLDLTNSKAFERFVVLHAHSCVPDGDVSPSPICQSNGCPTVSPNFLETLATYIDKSKKPVLLWIFE